MAGAVVAKDKLFGRYNDFVLLIFGFLLTGVLGSWLTQAYAQRTAALDFSSTLFKEEMQAVGEREFQTDNLFNAIKSYEANEAGAGDRVAQAMQDYRTEIFKWNSNRSYSREMIGTYFGNDAWNEERKLHYELRALGASLERAYKTGDFDAKCIEAKRDAILADADDFSNHLGTQLQEGLVGTNAPKSSRVKQSFDSEYCLPKSDQPAA
jgi:hypothetical protein